MTYVRLCAHHGRGQHVGLAVRRVTQGAEATAPAEGQLYSSSNQVKTIERDCFCGGGVSISDKYPPTSPGAAGEPRTSCIVSSVWPAPGAQVEQVRGRTHLLGGLAGTHHSQSPVRSL